MAEGNALPPAASPPQERREEEGSDEASGWLSTEAAGRSTVAGRTVHTGPDDPCRAEAERGAGTLLMAALALLALALIASAALLLQAASAASKAATAADLAALAAADAVRGITGGEPCGVAREVAEHHGARIQECIIGATGPGTALIRVVVPVHGVVPDAQGAALAGPPP